MLTELSLESLQQMSRFPQSSRRTFTITVDQQRVSSSCLPSCCRLLFFSFA